MVISFAVGVVVGVIYHAYLDKYVSAAVAAVRKFFGSSEV